MWQGHSRLVDFENSQDLLTYVYIPRTTYALTKFLQTLLTTEHAMSNNYRAHFRAIFTAKERRYFDLMCPEILEAAEKKEQDVIDAKVCCSMLQRVAGSCSVLHCAVVIL